MQAIKAILSGDLSQNIADGYNAVMEEGAKSLISKDDIARTQIFFNAVQTQIDDALHIDAEERERVIAAYPPHEREARAKGIPMLGSGRVFPVAEEDIAEPAIKLPHHWARIVGLDFGWDHPTAAVWLAWDRDSDTVHVTDCYRQSEQTPVVHAAAIKGRFPRSR